MGQAASTEDTEQIIGPTGPIGPKGDRGDIGPTGPKGDRGDKGDQGLLGPEGPAGPEGPVGPAGIDGKDGLPGPTGPRGLRGEVGLAGPQGEVGDIGPIGPTGPIGLRGLRGELGPMGPAGPTGPTGATGIKGDTGPTGRPGLAVWADFNDNDKKEILGLISQVAGLRGPTGPQGIQGPQGAPGLTEWASLTENNKTEILGLLESVPKLRGQEGPTGPAGKDGVAGPAGKDGVPGPAGPAGPQGIEGPAGKDGVPGPAGPAGPKGDKGDKGDIGPPGPAGSGSDWFNNRQIKPADTPAQKTQIGFGSFTNDNKWNNGWADVVAFNTWMDASGGAQNVMMLKKDGIGLRLYQGPFGGDQPMTEYRDAVLSDKAGNVGIGTNSPEARLHVSNGRLRVDDPGNAVLELKTKDKVSYLFTEQNGALKMYPGATTDHTIINPPGGGANVGIGNNDPTAKLDVAGNINASGDLLTNTNVVAKGDIYTNGDLMFSGASNRWIFHTPDDNRKALQITPANADLKDWNWGKSTYFQPDGDVGFAKDVSVAETVSAKNISASGNVRATGDLVSERDIYTNGHLFFNGATNKWIFHTPDNGRTDLEIVPRTSNNTDWKWSSGTIFRDNGNVEFSETVSAKNISTSESVLGKTGVFGSGHRTSIEDGGSFGRIAFKDLRFYDHETGRDMVTFNDNNVSVVGNVNAGGNVTGFQLATNPQTEAAYSEVASLLAPKNTFRTYMSLGKSAIANQGGFIYYDQGGWMGMAQHGNGRGFVMDGTGNFFAAGNITSNEGDIISRGTNLSQEVLTSPLAYKNFEILHKDGSPIWADANVLRGNGSPGRDGGSNAGDGVRRWAYNPYTRQIITAPNDKDFGGLYCLTLANSDLVTNTAGTIITHPCSFPGEDKFVDQQFLINDRRIMVAKDPRFCVQGKNKVTTNYCQDVDDVWSFPDSNIKLAGPHTMFRSKQDFVTFGPNRSRKNFGLTPIGSSGALETSGKINDTIYYSTTRDRHSSYQRFVHDPVTLQILVRVTLDGFETLALTHLRVNQFVTLEKPDPNNQNQKFEYNNITRRFNLQSDPTIFITLGKIEQGLGITTSRVSTSALQSFLVLEDQNRGNTPAI